MKKYNWGILAPGRIAHKFTSDLKLLPNANLYAVGSRSENRAKSFAEKYGFDKYYASYEELASDPHVDIVYIASPHVRHYPDTILCLEQGKAVLCEKPIAMNASQYQAMVDTARKKNVFFMEALWTRFIPSYVKFKELVDSGTIGEVKIIESNFCFKAPFDVNGRLYNPMLGGGALLDIGIYPVFMALTMAGVPESMQSVAHIGSTNVDESCSILFYHQNGVLSVLFSSFVNQGLTQTHIYGSKGYIRLNSAWHAPTSIDLFLNDSEPEHFSFEEPGNGYQYEALEAMKCLEEGKKESGIFGLKESTELINILDALKKQMGIVYPDEIETL